MKIDKIIPILFLVLMPTSITHAGHLRVMGGLNLSKYAGPLFYPQDAWKFRTGFEGGVGYEIRLGPHFSLEIDGMFIQKGSLLEYRKPGFHTYTIHYALNEISFPIVLKLSFKKRSSPFVLAGGEFSYIVSSDVKVPGIEIYPPPWPEPPKTKSFYPGLVFGSGFSWDMGKISTFIEVRLNLGLGNIVKFGSDHMRPRSIVLLLGLDFK
jgi:hypothetical protein